jgi:transposase-like protein
MVLTAITTYLHKMGLSRHKCQSWMCQGCKKTFGAKDQLLVDAKKKELALRMYAEGIAARKIERLLQPVGIVLSVGAHKDLE